ncbi:membrane protein insertion efficiency factor YidD [Massilia niastensis]|uniref:membrane protein insertion efficiency factor YidD n=1 Tax=Massilia niastensis TaxID=544911 RepID=UPI00037BAAC6|nr:membrane protein insertion efficiency factor YidD [Massilia niastensis]
MRAGPSFTARLALRAIRLYQRHLSPRKGFSCAYRAATGADGCSAFGHRAIARNGIALGLPLLRRRLRRCGETHRALAAARNPVLYRQRGECDLLPCDGGCGGSPRARNCLCDLGCNAAGEYACNKLDRWLTRWLRGWGEARERERERRGGAGPGRS